MKKSLLIVLFSLILIILVFGLFRLSFFSKIGSKKGINSNVASGEQIGSISTIIVPHHDLVRELRADFLSQFKNKIKPKTILLVSPNHFNNGNSSFISTKKPFNGGESLIPGDEEKIDFLVESGLVVLDDSVFAREHGINNLIPDIAKDFPESSIIPVVIKQSAKKESVELLYDKLSSICSNDCLLVASIDFSHYQPGSLAEIHDDLSIRALKDRDENLAWQAEVDSNQSLALAIKWAKGAKTDLFNLYKDTNSGAIINDSDAESTSYVLGWYAPGKPEDTSGLSFMVGGDMMFDRSIDYNFRGEKIFDVMSNIGDRFFRGTDLGMINLEGPISTGLIPADNTANNMIFNFPPKTTEVLSWLGINAVSLANNHSRNNGQKGIENTKKVLLAKNIIPIGDQSRFEENSISRFGSVGKKISVITINTLEVNFDLAKLIKKEKESGNLVLVFPHWGTEYDQNHSPSQAKIAHEWIDNGADIVIGSHPHVVQDAEIYKGKPVFYSLGNLLFDQTFSEETQRGLILSGNFSDHKLELVLLPVKSEKYKPMLVKGAEKIEIISKFREMLGLPQASSTKYGYDKIEIDID